MPGPYPDRDPDVLMSRFEQHAEQLRHLDLYDVKVAGGFLTVQLLLGSWFAANPTVHARGVRLLLIVIDAALFGVCWIILRASQDRRQAARTVIQNINRALGLDQPATYLPNEAVYTVPMQQRFRGYEIGLAVAFIGAALILLFS